MSIEFLVVKVFFFAFISFVIAILWTPLLTHFLYKYRLGQSYSNQRFIGFGF